MHTQFGMKICLILQESRGEGGKWGEGDDRREGKWKEGVIRSKQFWGGQGQNRINGGQDMMEGNIVSLTQHDYYGSL